MRLVLGGGGDLVLDRQMGQKPADLLFRQFAGMLFVVEEDESFDPVHISLFRSVAVMPYPNRVPNLIEQFGLSALGHGFPPLQCGRSDCLDDNVNPGLRLRAIGI